MTINDRHMIRNLTTDTIAMMPAQDLVALIERFEGTRQEWAAVAARRVLRAWG